MRKRHIVTLRCVALGVSFVSVSLAALANASALWAVAMTTVATAVLLVVLVGALTTNGVQRAEWVGASVWGWAYFLIVLFPFFSTVGDRLLTTKFLESVSPLLKREFPPPGPGLGAEQLAERHRNFLFFGHSIFVVVFAASGAALGRIFYYRAQC